MKKASLDDIEELESRVMDVAVRETAELLDNVATEERIVAAAGNKDAVEFLTKWKKGVANTYLLAERMIRYLTAKRQGLQPGGILSEHDLDTAQEVATRGVRDARERLKLVKR